jgi:acyl-CoA synthetase (AMP-forming)/AMP-acid ligase II
MALDRVGQLGAAAAEAWGDREFARLGDDVVSFKRMNGWSVAIAAELLRRGIGPGDRIMMLLVNRLELIATTMAAWRIGAIAVPVVAIYRTHELVEIVREVQPAAVVTMSTLKDRRLADELDHCFAVTCIDPKRYLIDPESQVAGWAGLPKVDEELTAFGNWPEPTSPTEECLRLYTSGSTSAPKGVRLNSVSVICGGRQFADRLGIGPSDRGLALAPVAHISGLLAACIVPLTCGAGAIVLPRWDVGAAVEAIDRHRVTWSLGAAVFLRDLVEEYERRSDDGLHVLDVFVSGGASTPPDLIQRADVLGMWAARTYGMTEAGGVVTLAPRDASLERRAHWDGKLADNAEARILGEDGQPVGYDSEGAIEIRGDQVLLGYTDSTVNAQHFRDGWFDPGDLGVVSHDGWMRITGRTKDIINRGGEKFSSADIESVLHRHPCVAKAAVLGVAHERLGESVCAFVQTRSGEPIDGEELATFMLDQGIAKQKVPTEWHMVPEIPMTSSGKVQKHLLRARREGETSMPPTAALEPRQTKGAP